MPDFGTNSTIEVLGTTIGSQKDSDDAFGERLNKLQALMEDLADIEDAGIELLLCRLCANTTKVSHLLRAHGCLISQQLLGKFDDLTATFVGRVLGGDLHDKAMEQASLGLNYGGLGFRKAEILAAPSQLALLIQARPCVAHLIILANEAGINLPSARSIFESNVTRAQEDCITRLDPNQGHLLGILCNDATETAAERFNDILSGTEPALPDTPHAIGRSGDYVLATPDETDPEVPKAINSGDTTMLKRSIDEPKSETKVEPVTSPVKVMV